MKDINSILEASLGERSVFHSEADFQHHLAWTIHKELVDSKMRLEYPLSKDDSNRWEYCDILVQAPHLIGLELKYKTKLFSTQIDSEHFELKNQSAQDVGRYDFLKDISRLETWCDIGRIKIGYAIILTNDHSYWTPPTKDTVDKEFRIHSRAVSGQMSWGPDASAGTMKSREKPINLKNSYFLEWNETPHPDFKYLLLQIKSANKANSLGFAAGAALR